MPSNKTVDFKTPFNCGYLSAYARSLYDALEVSRPLLINHSISQRCMEEALSYKCQDYDGKSFKPSLFKILGFFTAQFNADRPIDESNTLVDASFPNSDIKEIINFQNHQNAFVAFSFSLFCLKNSRIYTKHGEKTIKEPVELSAHSFISIIESMSLLTSPTDIVRSKYAILYEQLCYKTNPGLQYKPLMIF